MPSSGLPRRRHPAPGPRSRRDGLLWWSFAALCEGLTSANDVLALLEDYPVWVLDGLPRLADCSPAARQRFINLVDVLADRDITLVVLAHAPLEDTVSGARQPADLSRTASRLALLHTIA